jgi:hypothetical protein
MGKGATGPDALSRVLSGSLSEAHPCNAAFHAFFSEAHPTALSNLVGTRCRAFPEIPL